MSSKLSLGFFFLRNLSERIEGNENPTISSASQKVFPFWMWLLSEMFFHTAPASWSVFGLFFPLARCLCEVDPWMKFLMTWEDRGNLSCTQATQQTQTQHFMGHSFLLHRWLVWQVSIYVFDRLQSTVTQQRTFAKLGYLSANFAERVFG